jgi:hypothetical protein
MPSTTVHRTTTHRTTRSKPGVVSRRVAPFAPLAIALLTQTTLPNVVAPSGTNVTDTAEVCGDEIPTYLECHNQYPAGCSKSARYDGHLNYLKNLPVLPTKPPERFLTTANDFIKLEQGIPKDLTKTNHKDLADKLDKLGDGHVVGVIGYLYYEKPGGAESSNCGLTDRTDIDYHIGIGFDPAFAAQLRSGQKLTPDQRKKQKTEMDQTSIIVEMTPHWRADYRPAWSLDTLAPAVGHKVRVIGQLLADNEHFEPKDDCAFQNAKPGCWRLSIWELHPVTDFQVCNNDDCTATSRDWIDLENFGSGTAAASPAATPPPATAPAR